MTDKSTTVTASGKTTNINEVKWPRDNYGFTAMLRKEGARAIGRIKGDDAKLEVFRQTLKVLLQHANERVKVQKVARENFAKDQQKIAKAEAERAIKDQQREVQRLQKNLNSAKASLAAKKAAQEPEGDE